MECKNLIGYLPSLIVNLIIRSGTHQKISSILIDEISKYPSWFKYVDRNILIQTDFGFKIYCDREEFIGQTLIESGRWEGLLSRTIISCLARGDLAVDIGANIGYESLLMATAVGEDGLVLSFEPDLRNLTNLLKNIEVNKCTNILPLNLALSDIDGASKISLSGDSNRGKSNLRPTPREGDPKTQRVFVERFDRFSNALGSRGIRFVKIDVEGFEQKVLSGFGSMLDKVEYLSCEINPEFLLQCGSSVDSILRLMADNRFNVAYADPGSDEKWIRHEGNYKNTFGYYDAFFFRDLPKRMSALIE